MRKQADRKGGNTIPAVLVWTKCYPCKKMTWVIGSGFKDDPKLCIEHGGSPSKTP